MSTAVTITNQYDKCYKSRKISSLITKEILDDEAFFLDKVSFLRSIIEVARRGYYKRERSSLDKLPIGIAQARTSQLLIYNQISINDAYGLDDEEDFYKSEKILDSYDHKTKSPTKTSPREKHKAPYGAVTGQDLWEYEEVKNKIERINLKYNERYLDASTSKMILVEGRNLMRQCLGEEYGGSDESSGSDYSDDDLKQYFQSLFFKSIKSSNNSYAGYKFDSQKALKLLSFNSYKSCKFFEYRVHNGDYIDTFLRSIGLRIGRATVGNNDCLLDSYFQNI